MKFGIFTNVLFSAKNSLLCVLCTEEENDLTSSLVIYYRVEGELRSRRKVKMLSNV